MSNHLIPPFTVINMYTEDYRLSVIRKHISHDTSFWCTGGRNCTIIITTKSLNTNATIQKTFFSRYIDTQESVSALK